MVSSAPPRKRARVNTNPKTNPKTNSRAILWVEFFRTIWHSFGRFLAITAIIALGAGFFSGLKTAKPAMVATADKYLTSQNMYDLQIMSTQGFTQSDVDELKHAQNASVTQAEGVITHDILGKIEGEHTDAAFATRSLPKSISTLELTAGRLPETQSECVADSSVMGTGVVGKTITWASTNTKADLDAMSESGCTITGTVTSPDYLSTQRGSSELGDGKTYAFLYLPKTAFDSSVFTQIEATVDSHGEAFSADYSASVKEHLSSIKSSVANIATTRRASLIKTARNSMKEAAIKEAETEARSAVSKQLTAQGIQPTQALLDQASAQAVEHAKTAAATTIDDMSATDVADKAGIGAAKTYVLTRSSNIGYASFENDTGIIEGIALIFPVFFLFVAAMVCLTTVTKMIDEERSQIGLLKALGYRTPPIAAKYLGYSGLASLLGCVIGILVGTFAFPAAIWSGYSILYKFAPLSFVFDWLPALAITFGYLAVMFAVTWTVCWREVRSMPAELLRPQAPEPGKKIVLEHIGVLWNHLSFLHKVSLRNVFRFKKRLFMILAGVAGCTALIVACFGIRDSVSQIPQYQFGNVDLYSASVQLRTPPKDSTDAKIRAAFVDDYGDDLAAHAFVYENTADADITTGSGEETTKSVSIIAADAQETNSSLEKVVKLHNGNEALSLPSSGKILINRGMAHSTGLTEGSRITLRTLDGEHVSLTVSGIFDNYIGLPVYINFTDAAKLWSNASARTALVRFASGTNENSVYERMENDDVVQFATPVSDDKDQLYTMMRALDAIVALIILSAGALALIVLLNLTGINITERIREIATIKVLGFYQRETSSYVFRENIMLTAMGVVVGLPLGKLFHMFIMSQIKVDAMYMVPDITWPSYIYSALLTFAFLGVTFLVMYRRIATIDMAGALKSPE